MADVHPSDPPTGLRSLPITARTEDGQALPATVQVPPDARGLVLLLRLGGAAGPDPRTLSLAHALQAAAFATAEVDLLTREESRVDERTHSLRFDVPCLTDRVRRALACLRACADLEGLPVALHGAGTAAAAALRAVADPPPDGASESRVAAVVSRGGRSDLADEWLGRGSAAVLFVVGEADPAGLERNRRSLERIGSGRGRLAVIAGAGPQLDGPGADEEAIRQVRAFLLEVLAPPR